MAYDYSNNFQSTSYGGSGGLGGGGFMNGEGGSQQDGGAKRDWDKVTLRPLTIRQITTASQANPDAPFIVDGNEVTQITFVGQIRNIVAQTTKTIYKFDDGTGTVEVNSWPKQSSTAAFGDEAPSGPPGVVEGVYARVWGRMKAFNNKRHIVAQFIRPVDEYNEVLYHLLDATASHLFYTRGPPPDPNSVSNNAGGGAMQIDSNSGGGNLPSMSANAATIYKLIASSGVAEGLHANHISQTTGLPYGVVISAAEELLNTELVYTTMDEETWALLE